MDVVIKEKAKKNKKTCATLVKTEILSGMIFSSFEEPILIILFYNAFR